MRQQIYQDLDQVYNEEIERDFDRDNSFNETQILYNGETEK